MKKTKGDSIYFSLDEQAQLLYCLEKVKTQFQTDRDLSIFYGIRKKLRGASDLYADGKIPTQTKGVKK